MDKKTEKLFDKALGASRKKRVGKVHGMSSSDKQRDSRIGDLYVEALEQAERNYEIKGGVIPHIDVKRFVNGKLIEEKNFSNRGKPYRLYVFEANMKFSIMGRDLASLMEMGLVRIQVNDPGKISLYFGLG